MGAEIELIDWRILRTSAGTCHFVGCRRTHGRERVSSAIKTFDRELRRGLTRSGNVYRLEGGSAQSPVADAVWRQWCATNRIESWDDVTDGWMSENVAPDGPSASDARAHFDGDPQQ
jgi:hypothetical protein